MHLTSVKLRTWIQIFKIFAMPNLHYQNVYQHNLQTNTNSHCVNHLIFTAFTPKDPVVKFLIKRQIRHNGNKSHSLLIWQETLCKSRCCKTVLFDSVQFETCTLLLQNTLKGKKNVDHFIKCLLTDHKRLQVRWWFLRCCQQIGNYCTRTAYTLPAVKRWFLFTASLTVCNLFGLSSDPVNWQLRASVVVVFTTDI